jgi:hypothetical protein
MSSAYEVGRPIAIPFGIVFEHFAVISRHSISENPTLIALSMSQGRVTEEPWSIVVGRSRWRYATELEGILPPQQILARARATIGTHGYDLHKRNCEHFVRWATGNKVESKQVKAAYAISLLTTLALAAR